MSRPSRLSSAVAIDLRGLALLRIGLGTLIVLDLFNRLRSFGAHYGNDGVLPRAVYFAEFENTWHISLHLLSTSDVVNFGLFIVAIIVGLMLAVGYRTRAAVIASWMLLVSLHSRNPFVLQGGDEILRAALFWSMFLPLGARFSVDRALSTDWEAPPRTPFVSMATVCLVAQVVMLYAFASASKLSHPVWWRDGLGVYYALGVEQFTTRAGLMLREFGGFLKLLTFFTLTIQALAAVLLFVPYRRDAIRTILPLAMIGLHLGFALTMELGLFSFIVVVVWAAFLAPAALDAIEARLPDLGSWLRAKRDSLAPSAATRRAAAIGPFRSRTYKATLATLLVLLLWWNLATIDRDIFRMPASLRAVVATLRLEQRWHMFSNPPRWSQWFVVTGRRANGVEFDLQTGEPPRFDKPALVSSTFPSQRWRKYLNNIAAKRGSPHRKHFGNYMCREQNKRAAAVSIGVVRITMMRQATPAPPELERRPPDRVVLSSWNCADSVRAD